MDSRCVFFFSFSFSSPKCASCFKRFTAKNMKHFQVIEFFGCHKGKQSWIYFFFIFFFLFFFFLGKMSFPKNIPHTYTPTLNPTHIQVCTHAHIHPQKNYFPYKRFAKYFSDITIDQNNNKFLKKNSSS